MHSAHADCFVYWHLLCNSHWCLWWTIIYYFQPRPVTANLRACGCWMQPSDSSKCGVAVMHTAHAWLFCLHWHMHMQSIHSEVTDGEGHENLSGLETLMEGTAGDAQYQGWVGGMCDGEGGSVMVCEGVELWQGLGDKKCWVKVLRGGDGTEVGYM